MFDLCWVTVLPPNMGKTVQMFLHHAKSPRIPHATQTGDWQSRDYQSPSAVLQMLIGGLATKELLIIDSLIKEPPVPLTEDWGLAIMGLPILLHKYIN